LPSADVNRGVAAIVLRSDNPKVI